MSKLIVSTVEAQTFNYDSDTTGLILNSDGTVNESSKILRGWYLNTAYTTTNSPVTLTNWTEINSTSQGFKPSGPSGAVTVSSGTFGFGVTGIYRVHVNFHVNTGNASRWMEADIRFRPSGGSYDAFDIYNFMSVEESTTTYVSFTRERYLNITSTSDNFIVQFASNQTNSLRGGGYGDTHVYVERIGPAVT